MIIVFFISVLLKVIRLQSCPDSDQNCISCQGNRCQVCVGSFANAQGICEAPMIKTEKCLTYSPDEACEYCKYGYYLDQNKRCQTIEISNCLQVDSDKKCTLCKEGMYIDNNQCTSSKTCKDKNCKYCGQINSQQQCLECQSGYYLFQTGSNNVCVQTAVSGLQNCWLIDPLDTNQCRLCKYNYFYTNGNCILSQEYSVFM